MFKRMFQTDSVRCGVERLKDSEQIRQEKARLGGRAFRCSAFGIKPSVPDRG